MSGNCLVEGIVLRAMIRAMTAVVQRFLLGGVAFEGDGFPVLS
jgi:hypothetical protein